MVKLCFTLATYPPYRESADSNTTLGRLMNINETCTYLKHLKLTNK